MEKKIYIEFCNFDFSTLSATPLGKISIGTATPSLIKNIFVQIYNGNTVGYSFNRPPVILLYQLCTLSSGVKE